MEEDELLDKLDGMDIDEDTVYEASQSSQVRIY